MDEAGSHALDSWHVNRENGGVNILRTEKLCDLGERTFALESSESCSARSPEKEVVVLTLSHTTENSERFCRRKADMQSKRYLPVPWD